LAVDAGMQSYCFSPFNSSIAVPANVVFAALTADCSCARSICLCYCRRTPLSRDCGLSDAGSTTAISSGTQPIYLNQCIDHLLRRRIHLLRCQPARPNRNRSSSWLVTIFNQNAVIFTVALIWATVYHLVEAKVELNYFICLYQRSTHSKMTKYGLLYRGAYATNHFYYRHCRDLIHHRLGSHLKNLGSNHCGLFWSPLESKSS